MLSRIGSAFGFAMAVLGLVFLVVNHHVISDNPVVIVIQVLSFGLMIWARITFRSRSFHVTASPTEGKLVTTGPYRWLRHPIYAAVIYFSWACLAAFPELEVLAAVVLITIGLYIRMILEEQALKEKFPEYEAYMKRAKRILPFVF